MFKINPNKVLFIFLSFFTINLYAVNSPVPMLENTANVIIQKIKVIQATKSPDITTNIEKAVRQVLLPHVDVTGMSRSVLGRTAWNKASQSEKVAFMYAFTNLVIRTYAKPLANYKDEKIHFNPISLSSNDTFTKVKSLVTPSDGNPITMQYSLVFLNGEWKVYDLSVEGVSLLQSYQQQFASALKSKSLVQIIKELNEAKG
jgi:phospholipid transport system substrate-binding protein